eukprot:1370240-Amorphochlora_amoeboformis.AAC.1
MFSVEILIDRNIGVVRGRAQILYRDLSWARSRVRCLSKQKLVSELKRAVSLLGEEGVKGEKGRTGGERMHNRDNFFV